MEPASPRVHPASAPPGLHRTRAPARTAGTDGQDLQEAGRGGGGVGNGGRGPGREPCAPRPHCLQGPGSGACRRSRAPIGDAAEHPAEDAGSTPSGRPGPPRGLLSAVAEVAGVLAGASSLGAQRPARAAGLPAAHRGSRPAAPAAPGASAQRPTRGSRRTPGRRHRPHQASAAPWPSRTAPAQAGRRPRPGAPARAARAAATAPWPAARAGRPRTIHAPGAPPHPPGAVAGGWLPLARRQALRAARA